MVAEISDYREPKHCCWNDDQEEVHDFATNVLAELFWGAREKVDVVLRFFEKPWQYDELHGVWAVKGAPALGDEGWDGFVDEAERLGLL